MGYIKQLQEDLIKKIAAGEVIERPASVVKELVENSIDAGATKIEIEIQRSGKYIKIADNGSGIHSDDVELLFARHATSKLNDFEDLWDIETLGFRGEALASISSVSKMICRSKHRDEQCGFELKLINGKTIKTSNAISLGTIFEVDDLFYNVPARQKFLKSESTETGHIYDLVLGLALSHPNISFVLKNNKNLLLNSQGSGEYKELVPELLGLDLKDKLIRVSGKNHFVKIDGYISSLEVFRSDRKSSFMFINKRPIKCQIISKAISSAYEGMLPAGKHPVIVIDLNFEPHFVDINVHPSKKEVRYIHPNDVYTLVLHTVQNTIEKYYKEQYKDKSGLGMNTVESNGNLELAALQLYSPLDLEQNSGKAETQEEEPRHVIVEDTSNESISTNLRDGQFVYNHVKEPVSQAPLNAQLLFTTSNLQCKIIYSNKPIANMTKVGSKTIFEVGSIFDNDLQVVFNGEVIGDENYKKAFFNSLSELAKDIYKNYSNNTTTIQKKLITLDLEEESVQDPKRKKPPLDILYKVWERDDWSCVYCGKQLLDPKVIKEAMPHATNAFITYRNKDGEEIQAHLLKEHTASYDHYLPVSKLPQFNFDIENLFACCIECNRKKSDSMELKTWKPNRQNSWDKPLEMAGLFFKDALGFTISEKAY